MFTIIDGMYLRAFCDAIDSVVLAPYRQVISNLEKDLLKDRYNNVTYLQTHLENVFYFYNEFNSQNYCVYFTSFKSTFVYSWHWTM